MAFGKEEAQDLIFTLRQISEKVAAKGKELEVCFVDLTKVFDRVRKKDILHALDCKGVDEGFKLAVESLYEKIRNVVRTSNSMSREFVSTSR